MVWLLDSNYHAKTGCLGVVVWIVFFFRNPSRFFFPQEFLPRNSPHVPPSIHPEISQVISSSLQISVLHECFLFFFDGAPQEVPFWNFSKDFLRHYFKKCYRKYLRNSSQKFFEYSSKDCLRNCSREFSPLILSEIFHENYLRTPLKVSLAVLPRFASEHPAKIPSEIFVWIYSKSPPIPLSAVYIKDSSRNFCKVYFHNRRQSVNY